MTRLTSRKLTDEHRIKRESFLLNKVSRNVVKTGAKRVTIYKMRKGKPSYAWQWIDRKEYNKLKRDSRGMVVTTKIIRNRKLPRGYEKPKLKGSTLEKRVSFTEKGKTRKMTVAITAYTKTQKSYIAGMIRKKEVPVGRVSMKKIITDLLSPFRLLGIKSFVKPSP